MYFWCVCGEEGDVHISLLHHLEGFPLANVFTNGWASFHMLIGHLYVFFENMSAQVLCPFLGWVVFVFLSYKSAFCFLDTSPLSDRWFANIFSDSVCCLLLSWWRMHKSFKFWWSLIYLFFLLLLVLLVSYLRNHCLIQGHKDLSLYFLLIIL